MDKFLTPMPMVKGNMECKVTSLQAFRKLKELGWKVKVTTFGKLI